MSGINLNAISENASRLGARLQETLSEHAKDIMITRGVSSFLDTADGDKVKIGKQLDSSSDREKLDGLKKLIAMISRGRNVSEYFPQVVKNVASQNLEIRKLVYIYLLRYASNEPDLVLLSINTFQKDLQDSNPLIRSMALRVLSSMNIPTIGNIILMAVKKCAGDISPYVRRVAAMALIKYYLADPERLQSSIAILTDLLNDTSPLSIGTISLAFTTICPQKLDLLHKHFRRFCRLVVDADAWGQVQLLNVLATYSRVMLRQPPQSFDGITQVEREDTDLFLLLRSIEPLFMSRNPAVVIAVSRIYHYIAPPNERRKISKPLLRLLSWSREVERVILAYIREISVEYPELFVPEYTRFFVRTHDSPGTVQDKIKILLNLVNSENYETILREFAEYATDWDDSLASSAIVAIGACAQRVPSSRQRCLSSLVSFTNHDSDITAGTAIIVLKSLIPIHNSATNTSSENLEIIAKLARMYERIKLPSSRACILWLVGQHAVWERKGDQYTVASFAPDTLRKAAIKFTQEPSEVKLQTITLTAKLCLRSPQNEKLQLLAQHIFTLARYDQDYDVRDRVRNVGLLLSSILSKETSHYSADHDDVNGYEDNEDEMIGAKFRPEQLELIFFEGKTISSGNSSSSSAGYVLGSVENVVQKHIYLDSDFNQRLPDWAEQGSDPYLRETDEPRSMHVAETRAAYARPIPHSEATTDTSTPSNLSYPKETLVASEPPQKHPISLDEFYSEDVHVHSGTDEGSAEEADEGEETDEEEADEGEDTEEDSGTEDESSGDPSG